MRLESGAPSGALLAIDHPGRAEPILEHAEFDGPERLGERHDHRPAIGECIEDALGLGRVLGHQRHGEALHLFLTAGRHVGCHQHVVAEDETGVQNLVAPFRRHMRLGRRVLVSYHGDDLAAEHLLIDLEGLLTIAVEIQIGVYMHAGLLGG